MAEGLEGSPFRYPSLHGLTVTQKRTCCKVEKSVAKGIWAKLQVTQQGPCTCGSGRLFPIYKNCQGHVLMPSKNGSGGSPLTGSGRTTTGTSRAEILRDFMQMARAIRPGEGDGRKFVRGARRRPITGRRSASRGTAWPASAMTARSATRPRDHGDPEHGPAGTDGPHRAFSGASAGRPEHGLLGRIWPDHVSLAR